MNIIEFIKLVRRLLFNCPQEDQAAKMKAKIAKAIDYWEKEGFLDESRQ